MYLSIRFVIKTINKSFCLEGKFVLIAFKMPFFTKKITGIGVFDGFVSIGFFSPIESLIALNSGLRSLFEFFNKNL